MKKKCKRIISAALACVFLLAMLPSGAFAATRENHWAAEYIRTAEDNGWIDAGADADHILTRAEFAVILWKALGCPSAVGECPFSDVASKDQAAVAALAEAGVVNGVVEGELFNPDNTLTREQAITMLARAYDLTASEDGAAAQFSDWSHVSDWAQDAMTAMVEKGIVNGVGNNSLAPKNQICLGELLKITTLADDPLRFNASNYQSLNYEVDGKTIQLRFYENVPYVTNPNAPELQVMNIYVREDMADDHTAPIFMIQRTGQMKGSVPSTIENDGNGKLNTILTMLDAGYVVVSPGARGQDTIVNDVYVGRGDLPMSIVDLKAAVRYLHYNAGIIPGDTEKIIEEGHSSGGGISAVLGATGNSAYYEPYLEEIGAAPGRDDIYCAIVNSPIVDFAHIDFAYEWLFSVDNVDGLFADDETSAAMSRALAAEFEVWTDSLGLKNPETGEPIGFSDGDTYTPYLIKKLNESATKYLSGLDEAARTEWLETEKNQGVLTWDGEKAEITSLSAYINWNAGRWMKYVGCYDGFDTKPTFEMPAFGSAEGGYGHFNARMWEVIAGFEGYEEQALAALEDAKEHYMAEYLINPFNFIGTDEECDVAPIWYLRCGAFSETTGDQFLNLSLLLATRTDALVDFSYCWNQRHTWISDLEIDETLEFLNTYVK